ncbi:rhomboid-like protein [Streptomyces sp900105245]|uniref:rhomboid-like protein n=1 Tax=Streptomyces sp. 900105245 TaxID=3154379 RepID=UPI0033208251
MERTVKGPAAAGPPPPPGTPLPVGAAAVGPPAAARLLDGIPRQRGATAPAPVQAAPRPAAAAVRRWLPLPTPARTPFTFAYACLLAATSAFAALADPALVHAVHQASSTDVAHLVRTPLLVLPASALWIAGGIVSPYALAFLLVLTALERRIGGTRAACVFLGGHVLATLATEVPVGLAVLAGHLPDSSLHRLDYGISFGVATSVGALAGLLTPWPRGLLLVAVGGMLLDDLVAFTDPMTNWGHLIALALGVASWPVVRRRERSAQSSQQPLTCENSCLAQ